MFARSLANGLCELADLLRQPRDGGRSPALAITFAVGVAHQRLEPLEVHNQHIFANRQEAGRQLAATLVDLVGAPDVVVLGLPRGGVPVAREVADALGAPLDVFVVRKLGTPGQPELALGAVASGGAIALNDDIVQHLGIDHTRVQAIIDAQRVEVETRERMYRDGRDRVELAARVVVLVDDGLATGATMRAAVAAVRQHDAASVIVAAPVAAPEAVAALQPAVDRVAVVSSPPDFVAVGRWYRDFKQVSDDEVRRLLA